MKIVAYNGSPRKNWNTATLLKNVLEGAASKGADTKLVHLYDLNYRGCTSCFACKLKSGKNYGKCAMQDDLSLVLNEFQEADGVVFGSPIYFGNVTGELRSFFERLWFPYLIYTKKKERSLLKKSIKTLFVYTMNAPKEAVKEMQLDKQLSGNERICQMLFKGESTSYFCTETLQFNDYSKYVSDMFHVEERINRRKEVFPQQQKELYTLGMNFV
ncbi:MAG: flavodoxin family protein [Eubacteriales bacterium]